MTTTVYWIDGSLEAAPTQDAIVGMVERLSRAAGHFPGKKTAALVR